MAEHVVIAIPTFRRPRGLKRLLEAVAALQTHANVTVLVADNDSEKHEGLDLCRRMAPAYRWPLISVIAPLRGIAQVRNTLVENALRVPDMEFVAMVDDDEWPEQNWLDELLKVQRQTGADVLQGSVVFEHDGVGPKPLPDVRHPTGPCAMVQSSANILLTREVLQGTPVPWFDPAFALTGGEDREFFVRLAKAGRRFAWADEALVNGDVPQTRTDLSWVLARAYSSGNSDMRVLMKHQGGVRLMLRETCKIAGALLLSLPLAVILAPSPNRRLGPLQKLFRAAGKLTAMFGARYNEYSVVHGE